MTLSQRSADNPIDGPVYVPPLDGSIIGPTDDPLDVLIPAIKATVKPNRNRTFEGGTQTHAAAKKVVITKSIEGWFEEL